MKNKLAKRQREITDNPTSGYQSSGMLLAAWMGGQLRTSEPWFLWSDVPVMSRDPAIKIGIRVLRSRFRKVKIKKGADGKAAIQGPQEVRKFIWRTWKKFWYSCLPALMNNYYKWGRAPGGVEWIESRKGLQLDTVRAIEPWDVTPYVHGAGKRRNQFAGFQVRNVGSGVAGAHMVNAPHAFYFAGFQEYAPYCDEPRIAGAYTPWLEKNAPTGLRSSRRLYYWTRALGLTVIRHPDEPVRMPNGSTIPSEVLAIQSGVLAQNGSVVALPSTRIAGTDKPKWDIEQRQGQSDQAKIGEAVEAADREIWYGMGILPEIIQSGESGGYAGRSVSMETWLADADLEAGMWDNCFRSQVLAPTIWMRFGVPPSGWDYELNSLLDEYLASATPHGPSNQSPSPQPGQGGGGIAPEGQWNPDGHVTPSGRQRLSNPDGQHRYLSSMRAAKVDLSGGPFDESKVVRETSAHDGKRPGEFAPKGGGELPGAGQQTDDPVSSWVAASGLSDAVREEYSGHLSHVLSRLPDKSRAEAMAALTKRGGGIRFYASPDAVNAECASRSGVKEQGVAGFVQHVGGGAVQAHLDGGETPESTRGTYAHELFHAVDADRYYSDKKGWQAAYKKDILKGRTLLSRYAMTSAVEGFAEFGRLLVAKGPEYAKMAFPNCYKFFETEGLV